MKRKSWAVALGIFLALAPTAAFAHVTVQPNEYEIGSFARFVVRVPNERDDASTTKISVKFPSTLVSVGFQPIAGWDRTVKMKTLKKPIEVFGEKVTEVVGTVTWTGGKIAPGEFQEFGFSAKVPDEPTDLVFPALQTYSSGEVVRWIGPEDADNPAPHVNILDAGTAEAGGQLGLLGDLHEDIHSLEDKVAALEDATSGSSTTADDENENDDDGSDVLTYIALGVGIVALLVGYAALRKKQA
jgi:uncharacterized protein YcnI